jgi:hypothetical protein
VENGPLLDRCPPAGPDGSAEVGEAVTRASSAAASRIAAPLLIKTVGGNSQRTSDIAKVEHDPL